MGIRKEDGKTSSTRGSGPVGVNMGAGRMSRKVSKEMGTENTRRGGRFWRGWINRRAQRERGNEPRGGGVNVEGEGMKGGRTRSGEESTYA